MISKHDSAEAIREARRARILELTAKGKTQVEIAKTLTEEGIQCSQALVSVDLNIIKRQAKERIKTYIEETLPAQHALAQAGIDSIIAEAWNLYEQADETADRVSCLKLAKESYEVKLAMLTDAQVLDKSVKHVEGLKKTIEDLKKNKTKDEQGKKEEPNAPIV